eukprot:83306_1
MSFSTSLFLAFTYSCILHMINAQLNPTTSNSTGLFWIASEYGSAQYFQSQSITCSAPYCHIVCDTSSSCYDLTVYTTSTPESLIIQCITEKACTETAIVANGVHSVQLSCNYGVNGDVYEAWNYGACVHLTLNASDVASVAVDCHKRYACYGAGFYLGNTESASLSFNGTKSGWSGNVQAGDVQNEVNIACSGGYGSCPHTVNVSNIGDSFTMTCDESACSVSDIYCPNGQSCNIDCLGINACSDEGTLNHIDMYIGSKAYGKLNFKCNDPRYGCGYSKPPHIYCIDSDQESVLTWSSYHQSVECYGDCCPSNFLQSANETTTDSTAPTIKQPSTAPTVRPTRSPGSATPGWTVTIVLFVLLLVVAIASGVYFKILRNQINALKQFNESLNVKNDDNTTHGPVLQDGNEHSNKSVDSDSGKSESMYVKEKNKDIDAIPIVSDMVHPAKGAVIVSEEETKEDCYYDGYLQRVYIEKKYVHPNDAMTSEGIGIDVNQNTEVISSAKSKPEEFHEEREGSHSSGSLTVEGSGHELDEVGTEFVITGETK